VSAQDSGAERRFGGGGLGFQVGHFDRAALVRGESRTTRRSSLQLLRASKGAGINKFRLSRIHFAVVKKSVEYLVMTI
jgi:hypothetical protein